MPREPSGVVELNEGTLPRIRTQLDDAAFAKVSDQARTMTADDAIALALDS
jgi:hypothetical protein